MFYKLETFSETVDATWSLLTGCGSPQEYLHYNYNECIVKWAYMNK